MALTKKCRLCKEKKVINEFAKASTGKHGVRGTCKICRPKPTQLERKRNNVSSYYSRYGITFEMVQQAYINQNGKCDICSKEVNLVSTLEDKHKTCHIDHCHRTHVFRGLLCSECNTGLGKFRDDTSLMLKAINYLENFS